MDVDPVVLRAADLALAGTLTVSGAVGWRWSRSTGVLLIATAVAWLLAERWELTLFWHRALLVHLVLAYPGWRPPNRTSGGVVVAAYVVCVLFPAALLDDLATVVFGVALVAAAWWNDRMVGLRARHQRRRALAAGACLGGMMVAAGTVGRLTGDGVNDLALLAYAAAVAAVAVILLIGLRPPSLERMAGLVIELGDTPADGLRDAVARATRDPGVRVGFWDDGARVFLDVEGVPVDTSGAGDRAAIVVEDDRRPCCVVVIDAVLARDAKVRASVESAGRVVAVNARRAVEVAERVGELEKSRRRLVEAADDERAVLEAELRAGPLSGIVGLAGEVRRLGDRLPSPHVTRAAEHLERTSVDLTDVAAGLRPRDLEHGLGPALARLADGTPLAVHTSGDAGPLPSGVELTVWYFCSEALANAVKHARATRVDVCLARDHDRLRVSVADDGVGGAELRDAGGLAGLRDRVASYGGRVEVTTGPAGTTLAAELPLDGQQRGRHSTRTHSRANWKSGNG